MPKVFYWYKQDVIFSLQFNNSGSGLTKIHTGEHDVDRVAEYLEWQGYKWVDFLQCI
jgi:hypothetical protein